jgi:hypothetical protein
MVSPQAFFYRNADHVFVLYSPEQLCFRSKTVEVALNPDSTSRAYRPEIIKKAVLDFIDENFESLLPESEIVDWDDVTLLAQHVSSIKVAECGQSM